MSDKMSEIKIGSTMYHQIQILGERITTNMNLKSQLTAEPNSTEIYINGIPFDMNEDKLIPLFETIGVVAQFRLMMEYSGRNRGIGYATYANPMDGQRAIVEFNNFAISPTRKLQAFYSKNMRKIWLGYVANELDVDSVFDLIHGKVDPEEIFVCQRKGQRHFILKFPTNRDAADARRRLICEVSDFGPMARANWDFKQSSY